MEIVPSNTPKSKEMSIEDLALLKVKLKQQIHDQKQLIADSSYKLVSPASVTSYIMNAFKSSFNLIDGVLIGFKAVKIFRRLFKRFR
jgi:hypothetical protein